MNNKYIAMIPARLGSQRLKKKNLALLNGIPLISHAIRKCLQLDCFDQVWVNSEDDVIGQIAIDEGAFFHKRPSDLANNKATSEDFICEFLKCHDCEALFQVHSIAPLLNGSEINDFVKFYSKNEFDTLYSCINDQIEVAYENKPVNFTFSEKTNSQNLTPVQRMTWAITAWKRSIFLEAINKNKNATYFGKKGFYPVSAHSGHVIKTHDDLLIASALLNIK